MAHSRYRLASSSLVMTLAVCGLAATLSAQPAHGRPATRPSTQPATGPSTAPTHGLEARLASVVADPATFERRLLPNGLEVLVAPNRTNPMVALFAVIRAGVLTEDATESGLSHFLEHLLFNGTDTLTQDQLYASIDRMGAYLNATTRADHTLFQMLVPSASLDEGLQLLSAVLFRSSFPADKIDKERGIVNEELARDSSNPTYAIERAFAELLYAGTPLTRPVLGTRESLAAVGREEAMAYWRRTYTPSNMMVLVMGDASAERAFEAVERHFAGVQSPPYSPVARLALDISGQRILTLPAEDSRRHLRVALPAPAVGHPEFHVALLLERLLNGSTSRGLGALLQETGFDFASPSADLRTLPGCGVLVLSATASAEADPRGSVRALVEAVARAGAALTAAELDALKLQAVVDELKTMERIHMYGIYKAGLAANGGAAALDGYLPGLIHTGPRAAESLASRLGRGPLLAQVAGPGLEPSEWRADRGSFASGTLTSAAGWEMQSRLDNGLALHVVSNPASRLFAAHLLVRDRAAHEPEEYVGMADLLHRALLRGAGPYDADALGEELSRAGVSVKLTDSPWIPYDDYYDTSLYSYIRIEAPAFSARRALELLGLMLREPHLTPEAVEQARGTQLAAIAQRERKPGPRAGRELDRLLYGAHPLGRPPRGLEASVEAVTPEALQQFHRVYFRPSNQILTVVSELDPKQVSALVETTLGQPWPWPEAAAPSKPPAPKPLKEPRKSEIRLGAPQAHLALARLVRVKPQQRAAALLANALLNDRLQMGVRETEGLAYSVGSGLGWRGEEVSELGISLGTRAENLERALELVMQIQSELCLETPSPQELERLAAELEAKALRRRITSIGQAYTHGIDILRGQPPGSWLELHQSLRGVTPEEVQGACRKLMQGHDAVVTVR